MLASAFDYHVRTDPTMNANNSWLDVILRLLIIVSGCIAAAIFVLRGEASVLAPLALGGLLGAFMISRFVDAQE